MIEVRLLGTVMVTDAEGGPVPSLPAQPRRFALLAYLAAATPRGPHRRDHLLPLFWPELDQPRARGALRQALHVLRGELGRDALQARGDEEIGLDFDRVRCDVVEFERALAAGRPVDALELYRGPLLDGFFIPDALEFERWLEMERARLLEAASGATHSLIAQSEVDGDLAAAARWARRGTRLAPLDESLLRRLIGLLDRLGDRAGALLAYDEFAQRLQRDFEAHPAAETQALMSAVRARQAAIAPLPATPPLELVPRLRTALAGRYRVEREIARGGTAIVCLAHDLKHDRPVAIKVLRPELAAVVTAERFLREIRTAARLRHPRIVPLLDSGEADGVLYFAMPYITGDTLRDRLEREPHLPIAEALGIARDVAEALGYAHGQGLVHRDIKPENILLENGHATLADFGIARAITTAGSDRLTKTGIALGSPAYMSPEQGGEEGQVDGRSDLYALGCVLYEMLAGAPPFTGPTVQALMARHAVDPVPPIRTVRSTVPLHVERTVLRTLAKVPADRPDTAAEFAAALSAPAADSLPEAPVRSRTTVRIALGTGAVLLTALGIRAALDAAGVRRQLGQPPAATTVQTLAVLPFRDHSGDSTYDVLTDAMTMSLTTSLGEDRSLGVTSPLVVDTFKHSPVDEKVVGRALGVGALIEGDLQRSGESLRVDLRLIDVGTGNERWAAHFKDRRQNVFALEEAMTRGVLAALDLPAPRPAHVPPTTNSEAYDLYLRGEVRVQHEDSTNDAAAIALLERAVALDPSFAAAYAELAHAYALRVTQFAPGDSEARDRAQIAVHKALDLNPNLAEAHSAEADMLWDVGRRFPHDLAIQEDRIALSLNPNLPYAHHHLGKVYLHIGLLDSAIAEFRKTLVLDPAEGLAQQRIGIALVYQGQYEEGLRTFQRVDSTLNPALWHYQVAWALLYLGRDSEALALIEHYLHDQRRDPGGVVTAARAILDAKRGDAKRAEADIAAAITKGSGFQHFHHTAYSIAMAYALLHRPEPAVRFLRQAADEGLPCYPCFRNDPYLANIRDDPGFVAFMRALEVEWRQRRAAVLAPPGALP